MTTHSNFQDAFADVCRDEGRLSERFSRLSALLAEFEPPFAVAYDVLAKRLEHFSSEAHAPKEGDKLPDFLLPDQYSRLRRLEDFLARGPLIVSFNRGNWCEFCQLELRAFAAAHQEFAAQQAQVISIMPDRIEFTRQLSSSLNDAFPILCDMDNAYAMQLDLVVWLGDEVIALLKASGVDLEQTQGNGMGFVPMPATFVTDAEGTIVFRHFDPDFRHRADIEAVVEAVERARNK